MKRFNLLFDPWIPVTRITQSEPQHIAAYEIVKKDILAVDAPRADFNAALIQFLIGILQTVIAPNNPREWRRLFDQPPSEDELKIKFEDIKDAFYLDGEGYRFMQDVSIKANGNKANVLKLIPSIVGENTIEKNQDFFVKSSQISSMSLPNLISGLYLYQNYCLSETGGRGGRHHGSFRGRNTITAFIIKEAGNLWENLWLNIVQKNTFKTFIQSGLTELDFEWMNDNPNGRAKTDNDMNLNDIYWSMPRRVWINFSELGDGICNLTSKKEKIVQNIYIKENGIEYKTKLSQHPLISYSKNAEGLHPIKIGSEGVNYGDWLSFVGSETASQNLLEHISRRDLKGVFKIFVCGYLNHSKQAKTLCWYQTKMPLYLLKNEEQRKDFEIEINRYVQAANRISNIRTGYIVLAIKNAWYDEDKNKNKGQKKSFNNNKASEIGKYFWNNTESKFYDLMNTLYNYADDNALNPERKVELRHDWYEHIRKETVSLFNHWAFRSGIQNNPKRIAKAYNQLINNLNSEALKQEILALP